MGSEINGDNGDAMAPLRSQYLRDLTERQQVFGDLLKKLDKGSLDQTSHDMLLDISHKLYGTGATYGFPQISDAARDLENLLRSKTYALTDLLVNNSEDSLNHDDCATLLLLAGKLSVIGSAIGMPRVSEIATHLELLLEAEIEIPGTLIAQRLTTLIDACKDAHNQEPVGSDKKTPAPRKLNPAFEMPESSQKRPVVLIVDDDDRARAITQVYTQDYADIIVGSDAEEALLIMRDRKPDLVLLDNEMPGEMTGIELLERIQIDNDLKSIPVIVVSASDQPELIERAANAGAAGYVTKPFDPQLVSDYIKGRLDRLRTNILIVDDDKAICELMTRTLNKAGFATQKVHNGRMAITMMRQDRPDLVILDWHLPDIDGPQIVRVMRETPSLKTTPVMFLTARKIIGSVEGIGLGITDYITKPFDADEVVASCIRSLKEHGAQPQSQALSVEELSNTANAALSAL